MTLPLPPFVVPILIGVVAATALEILRVLSAWKADAARVHQLKVETHTLRLRLKKQSAQRIYAEERHRAILNSPARAA